MREVFFFLFGWIIFSTSGFAQPKNDSVEAWKISFRSSVTPIHTDTTEDGIMDQYLLQAMLSSDSTNQEFLTCYLAGDKMRIENRSLSGGIYLVNKEDTTFYLLDTSSKQASQLPKGFPQVETTDDSVIVYDSTQFKMTLTGDTQTIAGFVCKKAMISTPYPTDSIEVWFTGQLPNFYWVKDTYMNQLPGCPLKIMMKSDNFLYIGLEVKSVQRIKVDPYIFEVPGDYNIEVNSF